MQDLCLTASLIPFSFQVLEVRRRILSLQAWPAGSNHNPKMGRALEQTIIQQAFVSSTTYCILPVDRINRQRIGAGPVGPVTRRLLAALTPRRQALCPKPLPKLLP